MRNPFVTSFDLVGNPAHRTVRDWHISQRTVAWRTTAKAYARQHGEAKALLANGHVVRYWRSTETGTIRQRTYTRVYIDNNGGA